MLTIDNLMKLILIIYLSWSFCNCKTKSSSDFEIHHPASYKGF